MYSISKTAYGFRLTFGGFIDKAEMTKWVDESKAALPRVPARFGVFVDMRTLKPLPQDTREIMVQGQQAYKRAGMERSVVILNDAITTMQFKRLAKESGIDAWERYINAVNMPNWEQAGIAWVSNGIDPDKSAT